MAAVPPLAGGGLPVPPPPPPVIDPVVAHLVVVFGFSIQLVAALVAQGCGSARQLYNLYNTKDGIIDMVKKVTQPGGYINDPNYAGPGPVPQVPNRGTAVTAAQQGMLMCLAYYIRHRYRIDRPLELPNATIQAMDTMGELMNLERGMREQSDKTLLAKYNPKENIRMALDAIDGHLGQVIGAWGAPLTYVIRENVEPDNAKVYPNDYSQILEELTDRCVHTDLQFQTDNASVWKVIRHMFYGTQGQAWVEEFAARSDGRAAYLALLQRYLGDRAKSTRVREAKKELSRWFYNGKSTRFTFKDYVDGHKQLHQEIACYGERPLTEREKVEYFVDGITTSTLNPFKAVIASSDIYSENFDRSAAYMQTGVSEQVRQQVDHRNVSLAKVSKDRNNSDKYKYSGGRGSGRGGRGGRGRGRGGRGGRGGGGGYIPKEKWDELMEKYKKFFEDHNKSIDAARCTTSSVSTITIEEIKDTVAEVLEDNRKLAASTSTGDNQEGRPATDMSRRNNNKK